MTYEEYFAFGGSSFRAARGNVDASAKRYRYSGKERDDETGLHYYGARYHAAWLGRWTSTDPAGFVDGTNLYRHVANSPTVFVDRRGLKPELREGEVREFDAPRRMTGGESQEEVRGFFRGVGQVYEGEAIWNEVDQRWEIGTDQLVDSNGTRESEQRSPVVQGKSSDSTSSNSVADSIVGKPTGSKGRGLGQTLAGVGLGVAAGFGIAKAAGAVLAGVTLSAGFGLGLAAVGVALVAYGIYEAVSSGEAGRVIRGDATVGEAFSIGLLASGLAGPAAAAKRLGAPVAKVRSLVGPSAGAAGNSTTTPAGRFLTEHAIESLERHGFRRLSEVDEIIETATYQVRQADGAEVFLRKVGRGRRATFDLVVEGTEGIVTGMQGLTRRALRSIGRNNGWEWIP